MTIIKSVTLLLIIPILFAQCRSQEQEVFSPREVYRSDNLIITQLTENSFEHTSFKQTNDFGNVPCNGLIVKDGSETIIFDTPTTDTSAKELINWITTTLHCKINAIIPTHFHDDCLGGLKAFHENDIPSHAYVKTIELAKENGFTIPHNSFSDSLSLSVGQEKVLVTFFGEGHTKDNVVGYFPSEDVLFGGCLLKELNASKGFLGDATIADWSATVEKIQQHYPNVKLVVPGHGKYGNKELIDYTINLFKSH